MALPIINAPDHRSKIICFILIKYSHIRYLCLIDFHFNHENDYRNAGATVHTEPDGWIDLGTVQIGIYL